MLALAAAGSELLTARELAALGPIPRSLVPQVMGVLIRAGLARGLPGRSGGYRLASAAEGISLLDVVEAIDGDIRRSTCILRGGTCGLTRPCRVHHAFAAGQEDLRTALGRHTLADLAAPPQA